mgnify:FL=1
MLYTRCAYEAECFSNEGAECPGLILKWILCAISKTSLFCICCSAPAALSFFFQISRLSSTFAPILLEIIQSNQPEGVHLLMKEVCLILPVSLHLEGRYDA